VPPTGSRRALAALLLVVATLVAGHSVLAAFV
jgi:hypothetical protein